MNVKSLVALSVCGGIVLTIGIYGYTRPKEDTNSVAKEPTQLTEMAINNMVSTRIIDEPVDEIMLPAEFKVDYATVEAAGDSKLAHWFEAYNPQMIVETAKGDWTAKYIVKGNEYYRYDDPEKMCVPVVSLSLSSKGATYQIGDEVVDEPVECALSGYDITTADDKRFGITTYGCLVYECSGYSIILVKE